VVEAVKLFHEGDVAEVGGLALGLPSGRSAVLARWTVETVPYGYGAPATGGLYRVRGTSAGGDAFSIFVKQLQHVRHWRRLAMMPVGRRDSFIREFPWKQELAAWEDGFAHRLPEGLRVPELYRVSDIGDDRLLLWMEDIDAVEDVWPVSRYERAAYLLGGLAALRSGPEALAMAVMGQGKVLSRYAAGRIGGVVVPLLHSDEVWRHPLLADAVDARLRTDLIGLVAELGPLIDRLTALPAAMPHGDASPQNLLVPRSTPDSLVAIDISMQSPMPLGFDLGQLLVGLVHAGMLSAAELPAVHEVLVPAYQAGLRDHGVVAAADKILLGYAGPLLVRAGFTSLPFELLTDARESVDDELAATFGERAALTRFIVDLGLEILRPPAATNRLVGCISP
jgi:hypothetical protein